MSSTLELLEAAANNNHGITLQPRQVRTLAGFIMDMYARNEWLHNMCAAYMNEYGPELFYALTEDDIVEGEVEDAEGSDDTSADDDGNNVEASQGSGAEDYFDGEPRESWRDEEGWAKTDLEGQVQEEAGFYPQVAEESEHPLEVPEGEE